MSPAQNPRGDQQPVSVADLLELGRMMMAYVRPAVSDGVPGFAIHGADGQVIGFAPDRNSAVGAIIQHGMEPVSIH